MRNLNRRGNWIRVALITSISVLAVVVAAACAAPPETNIEFRVNTNGDLEWKYVNVDNWSQAVPASDIRGLSEGRAREVIAAETGNLATRVDLANAISEAGGGSGQLALRTSFLEYRNTTSSVAPVQISGSGFQAGETVNLEIPGGTSNPIATATANSSGAVDFGEVSLPSTAPTSDTPIVYTLRAEGATSSIAAVAVANVADEIQN